MKFRFGTSHVQTILFAIAFVSAAQAAEPELRVSYYERWIEGTTFHVWPCCANINDPGERQWWVWANDMYSEGVSPAAPFTSPIPWGKCAYTNITQQMSGGFEWDDIYTDRYETRLELLTGGETNSTRDALIYMDVGAATGSGQAFRPGSFLCSGRPPYQMRRVVIRVVMFIKSYLIIRKWMPP